MAHITITQLNTILSRIVAWVTSKFAAKNVTSGKLEYSDMPVVVLASMGHELDGTDNDISVSVGDTYFLPAGVGTTPRIMYRPDSGNPVRISDPASGVIYCNAYTGLLYRWDASQAKMIPVGGSADGLRKVYVNQSDFSSLDALHSAETSGVYQVIDQSLQRIIGTLIVSCDNSNNSNPHFVAQWLFSSLELSGDTGGYSGSINGAHYMEGKAHIIHRFYNVSTPVSGYNNIPLNTWSEWKVYGLTMDEIAELLGSKANDADVVKSISVNGGTAQTPTNGNVNIVVEGAQGKSAYQSYYDTTSDNPKMTEAQWAAAVLRSAYRSYLATTSDNPVMKETQWVASLKGPKGDTGNCEITDAGQMVSEIVNDLTTGGANKFLSAEMGKVLGAQVAALEDTVEELDEGAGYDINVTETAIVFTSRNMPHVSVGDVGNNNVSCKAGNTATTSFYVSGRKLTSAIQIAVSDATNWSVSPVSISPTIDGKVALTLVTITYHPASGTASGTTHNCNVVVSSGGTTFGTIAMVGTVAAAPSITLTMSSATITTTQDTPATATLNVKGAALEGGITLAISGTGFTLSDNTVSKADAESAAGADVTVTFDGSANGSATITANSTNATEATASVEGKIPTPLAEGSYFDVPANNGNGSLRYTVLASGNVSVKSNGGLSSTTSNPLVIPATVNDSDATAVYDSGGTAISASGLSYNVTEIASQGFINSVGQNPNIYAIEFSEGLKKIGKTAFKKCNFSELVFPESLTLFDPTNASNAFEACTSLKKIEFLGDVRISSYTFYNCTSLEEIILNGNPLNADAFKGCTQFEATSGDKPVVVNYAETYYDYRVNANNKPFPQNGNNKVWATLYCRTSAGFPGTDAIKSWNCFEEVLDISNYNEND